MARVAFVMDKLLRKIGLSGRSIVPMLVGFGCTVPGVMASRTLPSERDRKMTILLTPFMSCSAKLPIYAFFTAAFFPDHGAIVMIALYFGGIIMGILMALLMRKTLFSGEAVPFVMELPNYRMPGAKNVGHLLWDKAKDFLQRALPYFHGDTGDLVPADIQYTSEHCNRFQRQYSGNGGKRDRSDLQTNGIWRLEDFHSSDHWIYGKRERSINTFYPIWKYSGFAWKYYITFRSESSGFLSAVYTLCGSYCFNQT